MNIIELAKKACAPNQTFNSDPEWVERFAALVTAEKDKEIAELYEMSVKQAKTIKEYQDAEPVQEHESREDIAAKEMFEGFSKAWTAPVKQEPVAHYKDAPHTIYLQTGCDDPEDCECSFNEWGGTTWCADQIHDTDIPYIRADYAAPVSAEAIRARSEK